jgi:hypothetical protein
MKQEEQIRKKYENSGLNLVTAHCLEKVLGKLCAK